MNTFDSADQSALLAVRPGLDCNIWRECSHGGHVPREYLLTVYNPFTRRDGQIVVQIDLNAEPRRVGPELYYPVTATAAHQVFFACHLMVKLSDLTPYERDGWTAHHAAHAQAVLNGGAA